MASKPKIKIETSQLDVFLDIILMAFVIGIIVIPLYHLMNLPDQIPIHFDIKGKADGFGSKYSILLIAGIGIGLAIMLWWLRRYPHLMNFPFEINDSNAAVNYKMIIRFLNVINILTTLLFLIVILLIINTANGNDVSFYTVFLYLDIAAIFISMIIYFIVAGNVNKK